MKKIILTLALLTLAAAGLYAQSEINRPKLVVGIMVDQMRWDYLTRFNDRYCEGGFKRLMREGYNSNRLLINYLPTVTAVGHTSVYTGSVPAFTGIIGNSFPVDGRWGSSVSDDKVTSVGTTRRDGQASPRKLLVTTITDELRLATNFRSKVVSVAIKDRAAILPGGHAANGAYWMDGESLDFITSSYYMQELPQWVKDFNAQKLGLKYQRLTTEDKKAKDACWDLLYDEDTYVQSTPKGQVHEGRVGHSLKYSPYGNTYTIDMARAAVLGEDLGHNPAGVPDFLAMSMSCTDMIGHVVGPNSIYIEDTYLRLDRDIASFLTFLDKKVGKGNYVVFLSADHAGSHNVKFRQDNRIPASTWPYNIILKSVNDHLYAKFAADVQDSETKRPYIVSSMNDENVYFDNKAIQALCPAGVDSADFKATVRQATIDFMVSLPEVAYCFPFNDMPDFLPDPLREMVRNGYNPKRSGELQIILEAGVTEDWDAGSPSYNGIPKGTNHVVWSPYDAHIPFIVMGKNVRHAWDNQTHHVTDIAATIAALLDIQQPSGCVGNAIDVRK